jgi:hypothetical protein
MQRILALTLSLLVAGLIATPQETKEAKIERILAATNSTAMMDQIITQIRTLAASQLPPGMTPEQQAKAAEVTTKMMELMKSRMDKIRPDLVKVYAETFSDQEIDGMLAFYESPAGRAMLQKMPTVTGQIMGLMQSQMGDMMLEIQRITRETTRESAPPKPAN